MKAKRSLLSVLTIFSVALIAIVGAGLWPRLTKQKSMLAEAKQESERLPVVRVAEVQRSTGNSVVELPADLQVRSKRLFTPA